MSRGGKPRRVLTPEEIRILEGCSRIRMPMEQIADLMGTDRDWLRQLIKSNPAAQNAMHQGRAKASKKVRRTLFAMATKDRNFPALKFWCESQEGFSTASKLELSGPQGGPIETAVLSKEELKERVLALRKDVDLTDE